jgi:hypothetical protein
MRKRRAAVWRTPRERRVEGDGQPRTFGRLGGHGVGLAPLLDR